MLHEKSCLIINMPKIMIIKHQQFVKTNTFSLSFHILFFPFLHIFPKTHRNQDLGMGKNGQKWGWTPQDIYECIQDAYECIQDAYECIQDAYESI